MKVKSPAGLTGVRYGIQFHNGVGETDDKKILYKLKERGYTILNNDGTKFKVEQVTLENGERLLTREEMMNLEFYELWEYAKKVGRGRGLGVCKTKEKIIKHILG